MRLLAIGALLAMVPASLAAQPVADDDGMLRCAAAFAIVAGEQQQGLASANAWPAMEGRAREFFVQTIAARMERDALDRAAAASLARGAVDRLQADRSAAAPGSAAYFAAVMDRCLPLLGLVSTPEAAAGE
jgi:hypothetical protein